MEVEEDVHNENAGRYQQNLHYQRLQQVERKVRNVNQEQYTFQLPQTRTFHVIIRRHENRKELQSRGIFAEVVMTSMVTKRLLPLCVVFDTYKRSLDAKKRQLSKLPISYLVEERAQCHVLSLHHERTFY